MGSVTLSAHEVARIRGLVELTSTPMQPGVLARLMDELQQLIGCDFVACLTLDVVGRRTGHHESVEYGHHARATDEELEAAGGDDDPFFQRYWGSVCARPEGAGVPVTQAISQFRTVRQWRNDPMREVMEDGDDPVIDEILLSYPAGPGRSRRVLIGRRGGRRFGERELLLATLLQPHLTRALRAATRVPAHPAAALTDRQREILALVRVGLANKEIARSLGISAGTVRKHLENIYAQLGVQSRTAAATLAAHTGM